MSPPTAPSVSDPAFLAAVCHDLRGPLGAIGAWIQVLASGRADAATQQQALAGIQRDVGAQSRLIDQLADLSAILGGTLRLSIETVDLASLVGELGAGLQSGESSPQVLADPRRLRQLLAILLAASGAAAEGPSPVLSADAKEPGTLVIRGPARKKGPGLVDLTLARALAHAQGGQLKISSGAEGTAFEIQLRVPEP